MLGDLPDSAICDKKMTLNGKPSLCPLAKSEMLPDKRGNRTCPVMRLIGS